MKLGSGPIGLFYRGQIRAQKADITTGIGNGDTEDEAGDRETSDEEKSRSEEENNSDEKIKSEEENKSDEKIKSEEENNSDEKIKSEEENNSDEKIKSEEENNSDEKIKSEEENNSDEKIKSEEENNSDEKIKSEEENNSDEKIKSEEENKSEQEAPTSSHVHATAGKIDASIKEIENEAIKLNQENMEDEAHNHELSGGFNSPESQTKATYANHVRKSRQKKECTNPKENNRYDASTPHTHLHLQKPINEEERRASRERPKQNAKSARSRLRRGPRS